MRNILILGGDCRQITVAEEFAADGHNVIISGIDPSYINNVEMKATELKYGLLHSDVIITGLPASYDGLKINTPLYSGEIYIDDVVKNIKDGSVFIGGMLSKELRSRLGDKCTTADYYEKEELIIKNVVPTVEGAIAIAINETPITINSSRCLVIGYGRIGKYLSDILNSLKADVTVSARRSEDFAWIDCCSYKRADTRNLHGIIDKFDIIFNTVPHLIIDKKCIDSINRDCVIIDLASKPGGIDFKYAAKAGIKVVWALSLPGKTAPVSAGRIIKETTDNLLNNMGV